MSTRLGEPQSEPASDSHCFKLASSGRHLLVLRHSCHCHCRRHCHPVAISGRDLTQPSARSWLLLVTGDRRNDLCIMQGYTPTHSHPSVSVIWASLRFSYSSGRSFKPLPWFLFVLLPPNGKLSQSLLLEPLPTPFSQTQWLKTTHIFSSRSGGQRSKTSFTGPKSRCQQGCT